VASCAPSLIRAAKLWGAVCRVGGGDEGGNGGYVYTYTEPAGVEATEWEITYQAVKRRVVTAFAPPSLFGRNDPTTWSVLVPRAAFTLLGLALSFTTGVAVGSNTASITGTCNVDGCQ
jgi:hypothetical protein